MIRRRVSRLDKHIQIERALRKTRTIEDVPLDEGVDRCSDGQPAFICQASRLAYFADDIPSGLDPHTYLSVINLAPRLNVKYAHAHSSTTKKRLRKPIRKKM